MSFSHTSQQYFTALVALVKVGIPCFWSCLFPNGRGRKFFSQIQPSPLPYRVEKLSVLSLASVKHIPFRFGIQITLHKHHHDIVRKNSIPRQIGIKFNLHCCEPLYFIKQYFQNVGLQFFGSQLICFVCCYPLEQISSALDWSVQ